MRQLDARIRAAKQKAKTEPGPLARAVEDLADVVEQLRIAVAARDELERR